MTKQKTKQPEPDAPAPLRNRIVGHGDADPRELVANPDNWRRHPLHQRGALRDALQQVGWVQDVVVNRRTGLLVDGHLRVEVAAEDGEAKVPVTYVDLSAQEEKLVLAFLDPITGLAQADPEQLGQVLAAVAPEGEHLRAMLADLAAAEAMAAPDEEPGPPPDPIAFWPRINIAVPPEVHDRWRKLMDRLPGETDGDKVVALLTRARAPK